MIMTRRMLLVVLSSLAACSPPSKAAPTTSPDLEVFPAAIHTGVDEAGDPFVAPVVASDSNASFTISGSCCAVKPGAAAGQAQVTAQQPGSGMLTVSAGGNTAQVPVEVIMYTKANWTAGQAAYASSACGSCHDGAGQSDITSSGIPEHTDAQVLTAIRTGVNPEGGQIEGGHSFQVPDGIVAYLRSLPPKGLPEKDE
jgi:hypothetical protein